MLETLMVAPERRWRRLGSAHHLCQWRRWRGSPRSADRDPGAPTTYVKNIDGGLPWEALAETRERLSPMSKTSMAGPLGGGVGGLGAPTINAIKHRRWPPGRRCQRSGSVHHSTQRCWWQAPEPLRGPDSVCCPSMCCDLHKQHT
jgi:hypothetical protein